MQTAAQWLGPGMDETFERALRAILARDETAYAAALEDLDEFNLDMVLTDLYTLTDDALRAWGSRPVPVSDLLPEAGHTVAVVDAVLNKDQRRIIALVPGDHRDLITHLLALVAAIQQAAAEPVLRLVP